MHFYPHFLARHPRFGVLWALILLSFPVFSVETYRYASRDTCDLYLDIHRPSQASDKPAILYVFGGGFIMGARNDAYMSGWFRRLTENGYPVVAIDYRLGMKGQTVEKGLRGAAKAAGAFARSQQMGVEDVFSAIAYLARHPELGIDTRRLVIAGSSAGAIIALAATLATANGTAPEVPEDFRFMGLMSFAGAIISIHGAPVFRQVPCPMLLLHGTKDKAVAYHHYGAFGMGMWGSSYFASRFKKKGWPYSIWRFEDKGHDVAAYMDHVWPIEQAFLEQNVLQGLPCRVDTLVNDPSLPVWEEWGNASFDGFYKKTP